MQAQRRLVQWDPLGSPRFVVAGGGVTSNGDVRMYEWLEDVSRCRWAGGLYGLTRHIEGRDQDCRPAG